MHTEDHVNCKKMKFYIKVVVIACATVHCYGQAMYEMGKSSFFAISLGRRFLLAWVWRNSSQLKPLYWFWYLLPTFYNETCREFRISGGSDSRHNWFCNCWHNCRALLGLWSARTLVYSTLVNSHLFIGQLDPWSFRISIEPKSTRPSICFAHIRVKNLSSRTVSEAELCKQ